MISLNTQTKFLDHLLTATGISDVYFHKGNLYVVNTYDESIVEQFIDECKYTEIEWKSISVDCHLI